MGEENNKELTEQDASRTSKTKAMLFSGRFAEIAEAIPDETWCLSEMDLSNKIHPTPTDFLLRKNIITILDKAQRSGSASLETKEIYNGICSRQWFYYNIMSNPLKIVWLLTPIQNAQDLLDESFYFCMKKVRDEVLTMPVTEKSAPIILKALEFFTNRSLGPVVQRIEQKSMNVNIDGGKSLQHLSPDDVMKKYNELKSKIIEMPAQAVEIDAD